MNIQNAKGIDEASDILALQRQAFLDAGSPSLADRRRDIAKLRDAVRDEAENIVTAISADFGCRARQETLLAEIWPVVASARQAIAHLPGWMRPRKVSVGLDLLPARARILSQPLGVVGVISPWNYPVQLALMPMIAALAAGNRIMLKPSELTPQTSALLAEMLGKLFPREQVAVVQGGADVGAAFAALPFDHLLFTGSTAVGRRVMQAAAANLTPVTLELGGKSPCLVANDADLAQAATSIASGKLFNAGQTCVAPDYIFVPRDKCEAFLGLFEKAVRTLYPGLAANPDYTSIVSDRHFRRLTALVDEARQKGARLVEIKPSEEAMAPESRKFAPTLVIDPNEDLGLMREEIFGPILPVKTYGAVDEVVAYINARPRPLAFYYFGADGRQRDLMLEKTISGGASVNDTLMHFVTENLPVGGVGASGMGAYHGEDGFRTFSHRKGVFLQSRFNAKSMLAPPYGRVNAFILKFLIWR